ncbi:PTS sugar transporter subunit IIA [Oceanobacillus neutriphilus]|uniref:PTS N-acetylglucosamine transporter subunit IIBC n=1 Tax=Oceanobacillus neutriphilus TaxID=531815 RepID=A0ABQ2NPZ0_9BACI|nr:hypothetical protein [Oceanobacillus neutriphilus]GGP07739.1 PTS N-acetylglucosamine transporter subunit IIBC [Oceanobacillus neutriphilus]
MAVHYIIASHGNMAKGIYHTYNYITQCEPENLYIINAYTENDSPAIQIDRCLSGIPEEDKILVFTDIRQGSINQLFYTRLAQYDFFLVTGMNLSLLLELMTIKEEELNERKIQQVVEEARREIEFMNIRFKAGQLENDDSQENDFMM